jgi:peptide methionine sulfoxide reductase msrA/msrB
MHTIKNIPMPRRRVFVGAVLIVLLSVLWIVCPDTPKTPSPLLPVITQTSMSPSSSTTAIALFGNGCFWCVEHDMAKLDGVIDVRSGYAGGTTNNPTYENYSKAGHREVVEATYNPQVVSFAQLVEHILKHGDPTDSAGSFGDRGVEYAPALYYANDEELSIIREVIAKVDALQSLPKPIDIAVLPITPFYLAEEYHQDYAKKNPLRYGYYRNASGRDAFIKKYWQEKSGVFEVTTSPIATSSPYASYRKPDQETLKKTLSPIEYDVTQQNGTERSHTHPYDKEMRMGIYVDILSGEPLFSSRDKYNSGTGWPSFVAPITPNAVTLHEDRGWIGVRTEVRSRFGDNHLGHVFTDGPSDRGGLRYCMNGTALRFVPIQNMEAEGYGAYVSDAQPQAYP